MAVATTEDVRQRATHDILRLAGSPRLLLPLAAVVTFILQVPTIGYFFYYDDYVPFGEIARNGTAEYLRRLLLSQDLTPNWRVLPGIVFLWNYKLFGMDPMPARALMVVMHAGTAMLVFHAVMRVTGKSWAAFTGAVAFGLTPAYAGALGQVTTATQVMAGFFLVATFVAVIECALSGRPRRANAWFAASIVLYVMTIASHEGMAVMFPVFGLTHLSLDPRADGRWRRAVVRTLPLAAIGIATALAFKICECNEGSRVWSTEYAWRQSFVYLGRLLYPIDLEPKEHIRGPHLVAGIILIGIMAGVSLLRQPLGRIASLWVVVALVPHVFIDFSTASRYLYLPAPGFALLVAAVSIALVDAAARFDRRLPLLLGTPLLIAAMSWYSYQSLQQNREFDDETAKWRTFHDQVTALYPAVPPYTKVEIIGGPFTSFLYQFTVLPAFAQTTWGPTVNLGAEAPDSSPAAQIRAGNNPYAAEYINDLLVPLHPSGAAAPPAR